MLPGDPELNTVTTAFWFPFQAQEEQREGPGGLGSPERQPGAPELPPELPGGEAPASRPPGERSFLGAKCPRGGTPARTISNSGLWGPVRGISGYSTAQVLLQNLWFYNIVFSKSVKIFFNLSNLGHLSGPSILESPMALVRGSFKSL